MDGQRVEWQRQRPSAFRVILGVIGKILFTIFTLILIFACTVGIFAYIFMTYVNKTLLPTLEVDLDEYAMNESSIIYYHDSTYEENDGWVEYQIIHDTENRIPVSYDQIPDAMWEAAVAIEDHRFFEHEGVDWRRTSGAVVNMLIGMRDTFGGSTITQQLLKNITGENEGTVNRKVKEIFRALEFEKDHTKEQILELYLNTVYFGMGCYGVQTAAQYYFGKDAKDLSVAECASIVAITNNPSKYGPMYNIEIKVRDENGDIIIKTPRELNKERQEEILKRMYDPELGLCYLTQEEYWEAKDEPLQFIERVGTASGVNGETHYNSWFMDQVIEDLSRDLAAKYDISTASAVKLIYNRGYRIYTTMNPYIQEIAESVYRNRNNLRLTSRDGQPIHSAITILDQRTGNVVGIVGDMGEKTGNRVWSFASEPHQVGSSIKPLTVYSPALDSGKVTPASSFDNYPVMTYNNSPWPKNSPPGYTGMTNVKTGVKKSINAVAVRVLQTLGVEESFQFATEKLNLNLVPEDEALAPLGMGGLTYGLNTIEMAAAYGAIANNGVYNSPKTYIRVLDSSGKVVLENTGDTHVAMKETTAYFMTDMLEGVIESGTGTSAQFGGMHIAGKTGTTSDNFDRYFVGFTPYYVAAVWTGYKSNARINYSGNPAITMWKKVMQTIHEDLPDKEFDIPTEGIETVYVCQDSGLRATRACRADPRGNRTIAVQVEVGTGPGEDDYCGLHTWGSYCTSGHCAASRRCPSWSTKSVGLLKLDRESFSGVSADDSIYSIYNGYCSVHGGGGSSRSNRYRSSSSSSTSSSSSSSSTSTSSSSSSDSSVSSTKTRTTMENYATSDASGNEWIFRDPDNDDLDLDTPTTTSESSSSESETSLDYSDTESSSSSPPPESSSSFYESSSSEPPPTSSPSSESSPAPAPEPAPAPAPEAPADSGGSSSSNNNSNSNSGGSSGGGEDDWWSELW